MLIWCLKQLTHFIFRFSKAIFELVHCNTCFFSFRCRWWWGDDKKMMCISSSVIYWQPNHTFHIYRYIYIYVYIFLLKPLLIMWTKIKMYDEKPKISKVAYTWSTHFINTFRHFNLLLIMFKYWMSIYLIFPVFFVCWHSFFTISKLLILQCRYVLNLNSLL